MNKISVVAENPESTVVAEYQGMKTKQTEYQSEADLEKAFIKQLQNQAYDYLPIHSEKDLIDNLRHQLEKLNDYHFTDKEWDTFFKQEIANPNFGIKEKTKIIQEDYKKVLYYEKPVDNYQFRNILLIDKNNIHNNTLQVINQYETNEGKRANRYDATVLVNGLPLVHIELKRRGVDIKDAFNQINRYQNDSFWAGSGLYEFVQITCFIKQNKEHPVYNQHIVIIFDECHRSQFGEMHQTITKAFKKYHLFGFTGTPIFAENAHTGCKSDLKTTAQLFGGEPDEKGNKIKPLHTYTIVDAIADKNVLPFRIDYISTMKEQENIKDSKVWDINREKALAAPERISRIVSYILEHFNQKTMRNDRSYSYNILTNVADIAKAKNSNDINEIKQKVRLTGFNSIFAVSSIPFAKLYYEEFRKQMAENPLQKLNVATIFSFGMNGDDYSDDGVFDENPEDTSRLDKSDRDFLESAIDDYNKMFGTSYDTSSDKFQNYYKDVSMRMKNREIDLLIVVNMFLTGFDATTLNTLWVDKNLRMQGLLQAFSRTNRILNAVKAFGNIVCFRNLEEATNKSLALFGDKEAGGIVLLKTFAEYYNGYTDDKGKYVKGYKELIEELEEKYPAGELIVSEKEKRSFVKLYGAILRLKNILSSFDEFAGKEILSERDVQDYHSQYLRIYDELRPQGKEKDNVNDDLVFEIELIKQVEINIDYILMLIKKYHEGHMEDKEIKVSILKSVDASIELRSKKDLIENFIDSLTPSSNVDEDWKKYVNEQKITELNKIIEEENLNKEETYKYVNNAFKNGYVQENGIQINKVLPPLPIIDPQKRRQKKRETVIQKIIAFFNRFRDISTCGV